MKFRIFVLCAILLAFALFPSCSQDEIDLQDGYYTAEMAEYDEHGWKEFLAIYVSNDRIVTVEYNAKNASGFIKSWDMQYMRTMNAVSGTYPNEYTRMYSDSLLKRQDPGAVDAISGATHSYHTFQRLAEAALKQAREGEKSIAYVELPN